MKNLVFSFSLIMMAAFSMNFVSTAIVAGAEISVDKDVHDYGNIEKGADGSCYFTITNTGDAPLTCLLYTSPSPRDRTRSRMPSSA